VCSDGALLGLYYQNSGLTHSRTLLAMAQSLLLNLDLSVSDIGLVAVAKGPGSFTGVRIGVSAAKGLAFGAGIPVCGVSTLEAMAWQTPIHGSIVCPVMDARRGQVYNALFEWRGDKPVRLCDDRAISLEELAAEMGTHSISAGHPYFAGNPAEHADAAENAPRRSHNLDPAGFPCILVGDGAELALAHFQNARVPCDIAPELMRRQTAYGVALAAMAADAERVSAAMLEPSYLRPSQAERERSHSSTSPSSDA
jgi:tRNA threonylcarbamoyladenosine biosynthesis protein TsaB